MSLGIESASHAPTVTHRWLGSDSLHEMTSLTVLTASESYLPSDALPAPNLLQVLVEPGSSHLRTGIGIMTASSVLSAKARWWAKASLQIVQTSSVLSVPNRNSCRPIQYIVKLEGFTMGLGKITLFVIVIAIWLNKNSLQPVVALTYL